MLQSSCMAIRLQNVLDFGQRFLWLTVLVYLAVTVGRAINKNYQSHRQARGIEQDIAQLNDQIRRQELLNIYYQSDTFKELEARRRLGLKRPGEKVVIVPARERSNGTRQNDEEPQLPPGPQLQESNPRKWLRFLLGV